MKGVATEQTIPECIADSTPITKLIVNINSDYMKLEVLKIEAKLITISMSTFSGCENLKEIVLPESLENIYDSAFSCCFSLQLVYIGDSAFSNCSALNDITLSKNLTSIQESTFWHCAELENIILYNKLKSIDKYAFYGCRKLKEITIQASVTECCSLKKVNLVGKKPHISASAFDGTPLEDEL